MTDAAAMVVIAEAEVVPISPASNQGKSNEEGKEGKQGGTTSQGGRVEEDRALKVVLRRGDEGRLVLRETSSSSASSRTPEVPVVYSKV